MVFIGRVLIQGLLSVIDGADAGAFTGSGELSHVPTYHILGF